MEFALDASDLDPTCLMVGAWLLLALGLCLWFLHATSSPRAEFTAPPRAEETDPDP